MGLFSGRLSLKQLVLISGKLKVMYEGGIALLRCFELIAEGQRGGRAKKLAERVADSLATGDDLASALQAEGQRLPAFFVRLASAGERSGTLGAMFGHLEAYYTERLAAQRALLLALTYPALVAAVAFVLIPFFKGIMLTREPVEVFIAQFFWSLLCGWGPLIGVTWVLSRAGLLRRAGRYARVWPLGGLHRTFVGADVLRCLAVLVDSGMALNKALAECAALAEDPLVHGEFRGAAMAVARGLPLGEAVARMRSLPGSVRAMIATGDTTGATPEGLSRAAAWMQESAWYRSRLLGQGVEGVLITALGFFIVSGTFARAFQTVWSLFTFG